MGKILSEERVVEYSSEFKVKIVELTNHLDVEVIQIAEVLQHYDAAVIVLITSALPVSCAKKG